MHLILLTHERELLKKSGTGKLVKRILGDSCDIITWKRKEPSDLLENELTPKETLLVYPGEETEEDPDLSSIENFIIIDGTWQEANKIFNRSPYLKRFKKIAFPENLKSKYTLRRNQKNYGLCTIESVIELFRLKELHPVADKLEKAFHDYQESFI